MLLACRHAGQEYEARLSKTLLPLIKLEEVVERAQKYHPDHSAVIKVGLMHLLPLPQLGR